MIGRIYLQKISGRFLSPALDFYSSGNTRQLS